MSDTGAQPTPRIVVLGSGSMAALVAGRMAHAGIPVGICGSWAEHLAYIAANGITVEEGTTRVVGHPEVLPVGGLAPLADWVIVLTKAFQTAVAAGRAAWALSPGGLVLTLQNGLGHTGVLEQVVGPRVVQGVADLGAHLVAVGHVRAFPGSIHLSHRANDDAPTRALAAALARAGFPVELHADIRPIVWRKLAVNCAINPLGGLHGLTNGALLQDARLRRQLRGAAQEVATVAAALGIPLPGPSVADFAEQVAVRTAGNRCSLLQDLDRGRPTEIDSLNGAVVEIAHRLGVPVPTNQALLDAVRLRERTTAPVMPPAAARGLA